MQNALSNKLLHLKDDTMKIATAATTDAQADAVVHLYDGMFADLGHCRWRHYSLC